MSAERETSPDQAAQEDPVHCISSLPLLFDIASKQFIGNSRNNFCPFPPPDTPKLLDTLNADCIRAIFRRLTLRDLGAAANVCTCFKAIAESTFKCRYKGRVFHLTDLLSGDDALEATMVDQCLAAFGPFIENASIDARLEQFGYISALMAIAKHCSELRELTFNTETLEAGALTAIRASVQRLKVLNICSGSLGDDVFGDDCQIERLTIQLSWLVDLPLLRLPRLVELELYHMALIDYVAERLLAVNNSLRILRAFNVLNGTILFECIPRHASSIEELVFDYVFEYEGQIDFGPWRQLNALKRLTVTVSVSPIVPMLAALAEGETRLERLTLTDVPNGDALIDAICQMKKLRYLRMDRLSPDINVGAIVRLVEHLPDLGELVIDSANITFNGIEDVLQLNDVPATLTLCAKRSQSIKLNDRIYNKINGLIERAGVAVTIILPQSGVEVSIL